MTKNYEELKQDVENARSDLMAAEQKITANQDTLDLFDNKRHTKILNCKNVFKKVKAGATVEEDVNFFVPCDCFDEHEECTNRKCDHFPNNFEYMCQRDKFLRAKDALDNFKQSQR